jgi:hypothetical protein
MNFDTARKEVWDAPCVRKDDGSSWNSISPVLIIVSGYVGNTYGTDQLVTFEDIGTYEWNVPKARTEYQRPASKTRAWT